eukprot:a509011_218.p2 GENE.a509011_218~~a509011_218.p2  ORF type:complete len:198 (-),score=93.96 a509011_218:42-608(-)
MASAAASSAVVPQQQDLTNTRNIPQAVFIEDIEKHMKDLSADEEMGSLRELYAKYKMMETSLLNSRAMLKSKIPEIKKCLDMVRFLQSRRASGEATETQYLLADNVYANAVVPQSDRICLWLGAKVMLEYTLDEAESVLSKNYEAATKNLADLQNDLSFLKDQQTITEVNIARVFNNDVKERRKRDGK